MKPSRTVVLSGSVVDASGELDLVVHKPLPVDSKDWLWLSNITCYGQFSVKVGQTNYEQAALEVVKLRLMPGSVFRVAKLPVPAKDNKHRPTIKASGWNTTASCRVVLPNEFRPPKRFIAEQWTGAPLPGFESVYAPESDVDAILANEEDGPTS